MKDGHAAIDRIGKEIVQEKKKALTGAYDSKDGGVTRDSVGGRDILSMLSSFLFPDLNLPKLYL